MLLLSGRPRLISFIQMWNDCRDIRISGVFIVQVEIYIYQNTRYTDSIKANITRITISYVINEFNIVLKKYKLFLSHSYIQATAMYNSIRIFLIGYFDIQLRNNFVIDFL